MCGADMEGVETIQAAASRRAASPPATSGNAHAFVIPGLDPGIHA